MEVLGEGSWRVAFWNVAGMRNKDKGLEGIKGLGCDGIDVDRKGKE